MKPAALIAIVLAFAATSAHAGRKLLVLRSESSVDLELRKRVEHAVLELARQVDRWAGTTDVRFEELSVMIGCTGDLAACKDRVADSLAVDEIVHITIAKAAGDTVTVTVRRAGKGTAMREATGVIPPGGVEQAMLAQIGPLFGAKRPPEPTQVTDPELPPTAETKPEPARPPPTAETKPEPAKPPPKRVAAPAVTAAPDNVVRGDARPHRRSSVYLGGAIGGGAIAVIGLALWQRASSTEDELKRAPRLTSNDVQHILDLEARGDRFALWGNVAVIGGVAIAGTCGYLAWRARRSDSRRAMLVPVVFDHGGGLALVGGTR